MTAELGWESVRGTWDLCLRRMNIFRPQFRLVYRRFTIRVALGIRINANDSHGASHAEYRCLAACTWWPACPARVQTQPSEGAACELPPVQTEHGREGSVLLLAYREGAAALPQEVLHVVYDPV
eukprot:446004_1